MTTFDITTARNTMVSLLGSLVFSAALVAAAVLPAQAAFAATIGL